MKQRIKIAAALVHDPTVLLLDEPFNGADPRQRLQHDRAASARLAAEGRTIIFSSHILEEVERLAERVLVVVGGRLAASGDFREIRRLMTDRPHTFTLRTSDDRRLASALVAHESVLGVELGEDRLTVRTSQLGAFALAVPAIARVLRRHPARAAADRRVARGRLLLPGEPMIGIIAALTLRQLLGRGRTVLMGLLALLPILLAVVYRLGSEDTDQAAVGRPGPARGARRDDAPAARRARLRHGGARRRDRGRHGGLPPREARPAQRRSSSASCSPPGR